jgi:L-rhamnose mutarotase
VTRRHVRALDLVDDEALITEYRRHHAPGAVWPAVTQYLRATGVLTMEIWNVGTRLVMILEVADDYPRAVSEPAQVNEWESSMSRFQRPLAEASPDRKWTELERIFTLDAPSDES